MSPCRDRLAALLPLLFLLACSSPAASATRTTRSVPVFQQEEKFEPITFGDDEYTYSNPFFPGTEYDPSIPTADAMLGGLQGSRLSHHDEILACYRAWAEASPIETDLRWKGGKVRLRLGRPGMG